MAMQSNYSNWPEIVSFAVCDHFISVLYIIAYVAYVYV